MHTIILYQNGNPVTSIQIHLNLFRCRKPVAYKKVIYYNQYTLMPTFIPLILHYTLHVLCYFKIILLIKI